MERGPMVGLGLLFFVASLLPCTRGSGCFFPVAWHGEYFHLGYSQPLLIINSTISGKGKCLENTGSQYIMEDKEYGERCWRCMTIFRKHHNVLQYRESYCETFFESFEGLCSGIAGDSPMYSMFRRDAEPEVCPFGGPFTFSYAKGGSGAVCSFPRSYLDTCQDPTKLQLSFQACTDIPGSESSSEEVRCLAGWKEGSKHYLVGEVVRQHAISHEQLIRCFIYEKHGKGGTRSIRMAESMSATCSGLWTPLEGARTFDLQSVDEPSEGCHLPDWIQTTGRVWKSLDSAISLHLYSEQRFSLENFLDSVNPERSQAACHTVLRSDPAQARLVNYVRSDCDSGFVCTVFTRKSRHVITVQFGQKSAMPGEACSDLYFSQYVTKTVLLVSSEAAAAGSSEACALSGKYQLTPLAPDILELTDCPVGSSPLHLVAECGASSLSLEWTCPDTGKLTRRRYSCTSSWSSRGRTHQILTREEEEDRTRLCLTQTDRMVSVSEHNCAGVQPHYNISETGPCVQALSSPPSHGAAVAQSSLVFISLSVLLLVLKLS